MHALGARCTGPWHGSTTRNRPSATSTLLLILVLLFLLVHHCPPHHQNGNITVGWGIMGDMPENVDQMWDSRLKFQRVDARQL